MDFSERLINSTDWATYLLVGCFVLYALSKYYYPKRFHEFSLLPITNQYFFVHGKNDELNHPFNMMLFVAQLICVSVFVFWFLKSSIQWKFKKMNGYFFKFLLVTEYLF